MGWYFTDGQNHRSDLIAERVKSRDWTNDDGTVVKMAALKHCYKGGMRSGVLYVVWEQTRTPKTGAPESKRFIEIDLLKYHGGWGYKDMEESMGPVACSCPLSYLEMVPEQTCQPDCETCKKDSCSRKWGRDWRGRVRAYHERKKAEREQRKLIQGRT